MNENSDERHSRNFYLKKRRKGRSLYLFAFTFFSAFFVFSVCASLLSFYLLTRDLPDVKELKTYTPSLITKVYADNGELIKEFFIEKRILVPFETIPQVLKQATLAVEDARFFAHKGLDDYGILRAIITNIKARGVVEGGSTITQQLAKSMFLTPQRTLRRKIKEAILAIRLERHFSKQEIFEIYLNQIYYGHGAYGVETAARTYFGKHVEELDLPESAMIAGLPRAPNNYSPYFSLEKARVRRDHVLKRMAAEGFISASEAAKASKAPFELVGLIKDDDKAPYFSEHVRKYLEKKYGSTKIYRGGLEVYTTLNIDQQRAAQQALRRGLRVLDKRIGYRGPLGHIEIEKGAKIDWDTVYNIVVKEKRETPPGIGDRVKGVVVDINDEEALVDFKIKKGILHLNDMLWARQPDPEIDSMNYKIKSPRDALKIGDIVEVRIKSEEEGKTTLALEQEPLVQGAVLSLEPQTGFVRVMVGGYDYGESKFNRVTQALRQAGSAFKPIIYSAAFEQGFTAADIIIDSPIIFSEEEKEEKKKVEDWKPANFEEKFYGPTTLHTALIHSRNVVTIKLFRKVGLKNVVSYARRLGIVSPLNQDLSLALGSSSLTLWELTSAYGVFANGGVRTEPVFIKVVKDSNGNILEENSPVLKQVIPEEVAYITTSILQDVVQRGTGWRAKALGRPVAGKTGTTNNYQDAWFIGYTPSMVSGVWVGFDRNESLGKNETGSRAAAPIWVDFMRKVLKTGPVRNFPVPSNLVFAKINPEDGLLASPDSKDFVFQPFLKGTEPKKYSQRDSKDFFRLDLER
jgi:penicillin-binding protein 1A